MDATQQHNHILKLHAMQASGALPREYGVHQITVLHDAWCHIYQGGYCHCDPDVQLSWSLAASSEN